ncbi:MAG: hypothetical protein GTO02_23200, partial [Candidatus Dadabacteria bacterium]|nr:hypothetical protein [Candidatus Dadabacteria bacterium]
MKIIKDILKIIINKSLGYLGLKITKLVNTKPVKTWDVGLKKISDDGSFDFSDNNKINPRYIGYLIHGNTVLVNVNPDNGRGLPIHRYGITGNHPFVAASIIALRNPKEAQFKHIYDVLEQYYISVCPSTAGEL